MSALLVLSCDGRSPSGMRCRAALPTKEKTRADARRVSPREGWTYYIDVTLDVVDLCPSCSKRAAS